MSQKKLKKETILQYLAKPAVYTLIPVFHISNVNQKFGNLIHEFQRIEIRGALHGRGIYNFQTGQTTLVLCMIFGLT